MWLYLEIVIWWLIVWFYFIWGIFWPSTLILFLVDILSVKKCNYEENSLYKSSGSMNRTPESIPLNVSLNLNNTCYSKSKVWFRFYLEYIVDWNRVKLFYFYFNTKECENFGGVHYRCFLHNGVVFINFGNIVDRGFQKER